MSETCVMLKDVCDKASSNIAQKDLAAHEGPYPIYGASGFIKNVDFFQRDKEYIAVVKDGAGIGRTLKLPAQSSVIGTMQYILPKENVDISYLYYAISAMHLEKYFSGATIPHIYFRDYQKEKLRLPALDEQQRIASILEKVEALIVMRKQQISKLDELVRSRFIEMFGEMSLSNEKWKKIQLSQVIQSIEAGWSANGIQREKVAGEIAVLKVSAVTKGYFIPTEYKVLNNQKDIKKYVFPQKGDLLFSRANTKEMVGATAVVTEDYPDLILPDKLWKIELNKDANVFFIKYALSCENVRNRLSNDSTGTSGSMYNISMQKLKSLKIPLPPIELQDKFADFVNSTDKSKTAIQKSLDDLETLKKSLMQQYFA